MKKTTKIAVAAILTAVIAAVAYYVVLPPLSLYSELFWMSITFVALLFGAVYLILSRKGDLFSAFKEKKASKVSMATGTKVLIAVAALPIVVLALGNLLSSTLFNATKYASIIEVEEAVFEEDMPENDRVTNIPLMDSNSAQIIGERELGELDQMVSQYQVNGTYSQINSKGMPKKVSSLEYVDFFRWWNNRESGIPGYIMVDPVDFYADYVAFEDPILYTDSAFFSKDLQRKLRFSFPTKIFGSCMFEIDEEGNPHYIVSCMKPQVGLFGGMDVEEVIIFDPTDGSAELYGVDETPSWVDNVFTGLHASEKYDWHGTLKNGFWNSVIGKKDCKVTTDDYGYLIKGDDVWFFTGVTSVSADESNIGFILSNARTGEYKYYPVKGAEEYSAMGVAQGEVQEKGYTASFPSLINIAGEATYIMVLNDANGVVKMCALVNVENYNLVATGTTQADAKQAYIQLLRDKGVITEEEDSVYGESAHTVTVTVTELRMVTVDGNSVLYVSGDDGTLYKQAIAADESLLLIQVGDRVEISCFETDAERIRQIEKWSFAETAEETE